MHKIFINFKQTFDQLKINQLMKNLTEVKIPNKINDLMQITMKETNAIINREK